MSTRLRIRERLSSSIAMISHASSKRQALVSRVNDLQKAWKAGEVPVVEYLRARRTALQAKEEEQIADIAWRNAIVRLMISSGDMP